MRIAKKQPMEEGLTLSVVKDECVLFETASHGIFGPVESNSRAWRAA
jgi:hypothetical protein